MKRILKDYFSLSKRERTAVVILGLLIVVFMVTPFFYRTKTEKPQINKVLADFIAQSNAPTAGNDSSEEFPLATAVGSTAVKVPHSLFSFDPNTLSADGWQKLGLNDRTIRTILHYRSKGGRFRSPEDIRKIWGIQKELAAQLIPYVRLTGMQAGSFMHDKQEDKNAGKHPVLIDINTASSEEWQSLPGIGQYMGERIVKYREKIGGFTGLDQLKTTYGITDSVFTLIRPYVKTDSSTTPKINLNTASFYDLTRKAGISEPVARAILIYRQQFGPFSSIADLKKIIFINDSVLQHISKIAKVN